MSRSRLDQLYRRLLLSKFFTKGWGKPDNLKRIFAFRKILSNRETCQHLVASDYPIHIDKEYKDGDCRVLEGHFLSPFVHHLPGIMPKEVETANFQMILPVQWRHPIHRPVCIHLAGTGDHFYWRRRLLTARPLLKEAGIASIILENPYYGSRKPKEQLRSSLHNVSDLFVMGGALVLESLALLHWCEREGWGPLGISGVSMGGHMASGVATLWPKPLSVVPILSWTTASISFTEGVMSGAIPWHTLQEQFFENNVYQDEIRKLIVSPEQNRRKAYDMGQDFVKNYADRMPEMESLHQQQEAGASAVAHTAILSQGVAPGSLTTADLRSSSKEINSENSNSKVGPSVVESGTPGHPSQAAQNENLKGDVSKVNVSLSLEGYVAHTGIRNSKSSNEPFQSSTGHKTVSSAGTDSRVFSSVATSQSTDHSKSASPHTSGVSAPEVETATVIENSGKAKPKRSSRKDSVKPLTVSYAQAKTNQQAKLSSPSPGRVSGALTLKHALSKSKLILSRQPSSLPTEEEKLKTLQQEALDFMCGVMDECTHLGNFSVPVDPELIIIIAAKQDAYIPRDGVIGLDQLWPGCEVRYIDNGHVGAVLWHQRVFRQAVIDAFAKQEQKYPSGTRSDKGPGQGRPLEYKS
ncbi:protein ABHD18 isoform X2 [Aplysia californica]|uniref:Protein ABHD18 isoform X2 n=1 Tax=Aplysia californica TaxID=6500 RepID=A0ABM1VPN7_APLCA|nr:protein ABHD18 isoform X2 [Aplysia californica]